jgi:chromosome segregation ATPase
MKNRHAAVWMLYGPGCLLASMALLIWKAAPLLFQPVWIAGIVLTIFLSCLVMYLTYQEIVSNQTSLKEQLAARSQAIHSTKQAFEEARSFYREKIEKLELAISSTEKALETVQQQFATLQEETKAQKNHTQAFQISLEDALDQLRAARAKEYFQEETGKRLPQDLPGKHRQLREQFEEKSLVLDQTRRRLFQLEGQLIAAKKESLEDREEEILLASLDSLLEENHYLEGEIKLLEKLIASKPKKEKKTEKKPEPALELF